MLDVLCVPKLSYNLVSVPKAAEAGKTTEFDDAHCRIFCKNRKLVAIATKVGSLYYLECTKPTGENPRVNSAETQESKAYTWHRRFGHLGVQNLQKLTRDKMVESRNFDVSTDLKFCEMCVGGKHHRSPFQSGTSARSDEPLGLVQ